MTKGKVSPGHMDRVQTWRSPLEVKLAHSLIHAHKAFLSQPSKLLQCLR